MIDTKEFEGMCREISNVETKINYFRKHLFEIESKIKELKSKNLSRDETLTYLSYKLERKELGNKIKILKEYKKELSKKISEYERNYIEGEKFCYKKCKYIKFDGNNIEDVFKFSHSSNYTFNNEQLLIYGKKDILINVGEYLVFDNEEYLVYSEDKFNRLFSDDNCNCCGCCDDEEFK